jgi:hypothetical protein
MNERQLRQAIQEIAQEAVAGDLDLWPALRVKVGTQLRRPRWATGGKTLLRLAGAGVALATVAFFVLWLSSLPQMLRTTPTADGTAATPATLTIHRDYDVATAVTLNYPAAPSTLPRYLVEVTSPPDTAEEIIAWANDFGLPDAKLFRDPRSLEILFALGSTGEQLSFYSPLTNFYTAMERFSGVFTNSPTTDYYYAIGYSQADWLELPDGETFPLEAGAAVAVAFLEQHNQLPEQYHVRDLLSHIFTAGGYPLRLIHVSPDLEGYPTVGSRNARVGATLQIDAAGEIVFAGFSDAVFTPMETTAVQPAQEVVTDFVSGRLNPIDFDAMPVIGGWPDVVHYNPPLPEHTIGERITVLETDDTHFLVAEDGSEVRATLRTGVGARYELLMPDLAQIAATIESDELQVTGTIVGQTAADTWQLEVEAWEILRQQVLISGCAVGIVEIDAAGTAWITAEKTLGQVAQNERYRIPDLPPAINHGEQIEVCSEKMVELGEELKWTTIYAPPRALDDYGFSQPNIRSEQSEWVIEHVELAYYADREADANLVEPVWTVDGYSQDGTMRFVAVLPATTEDLR